jgi:hypothetical protein
MKVAETGLCGVRAVLISMDRDWYFKPNESTIERDAPQVFHPRRRVIINHNCKLVERVNYLINDNYYTQYSLSARAFVCV